MIHAVKDTVLAAAMASFPPVREQCPGCKGVTTIEIPHGEIDCPNCTLEGSETGGTGYVLREMDAREEHAYLLILMKRLMQYVPFKGQPHPGDDVNLNDLEAEDRS